eukprot:scaffold90511_cov63-Phaeocystis_antarctica.AAC.2
MATSPGSCRRSDALRPSSCAVALMMPSQLLALRRATMPHATNGTIAGVGSRPPAKTSAPPARKPAASRALPRSDPTRTTALPRSPPTRTALFGLARACVSSGFGITTLAPAVARQRLRSCSAPRICPIDRELAELNRGC